MRHTKESIVLVCEGSETEAYYFGAVSQWLEQHGSSWSEVLVVPRPVEKSLPKPERVRQLKAQSPNRDELKYYYKYEANRVDYEYFCSQPLRYVREAELFVQEDGYSEAWAVFDNDKFKYLDDAFAYVDKLSNVHIAYSSISIETFFLAHFEQNYRAFAHSAELIAYLDSTFLPGYQKNEVEHIFEDYTLDQDGQISIRLLLNASWLRSLSAVPLGERNPYTNVDRLLQRLLSDSRRIEWVGECIDINERYAIAVDCASEHCVVRNIGSSSILLNDHSFYAYTDMGERRTILCSSLLLSPGDCSSGIPIPIHAHPCFFSNGIEWCFLPQTTQDNL